MQKVTLYRSFLTSPQYKMLSSQTGTRAQNSRGTTLIPVIDGLSVRYDQNNLVYTCDHDNGRRSRLPYWRCSAFRLQLRRDFPSVILTRLSPPPGSLTGRLRRTRLHQDFYSSIEFTCALCHTHKHGSMTLCFHHLSPIIMGQIDRNEASQERCSLITRSTHSEVPAAAPKKE